MEMPNGAEHGLEAHAALNGLGFQPVFLHPIWIERNLFTRPVNTANRREGKQ
jgi:hypothetical protein